MLTLGALLATCDAGEERHVTDAQTAGAARPHARAAEVVGGADANITWPGTNNYYQSYDNLRFRVEITSILSQIEIGAWTQNSGWWTLTGSSVVPISNNAGLFHRRVNWPFNNGTKYDLVMRYKYDGSWTDCAGSNPSDTNQYLHADVKVHRLRIHNTSESGWSANWTAADVSKIVDRISSAVPGASSNTIDGIYGQCGSMIGATKKTQWRLSTVNTIGVPQGCTDFGAILESETCACDVENCQFLHFCIENMLINAGHTNNDYARVYVVDRLGCEINGVNWTLDNGIQFVAIENWLGPASSEERATRVLAHELGHALGLNHVSQAWANCDATQPIDRNLMCATNAGRLLQNTQPPQQCTDILDSTILRDWN
jgi:hypothetical protein